MAMSAYIHTYNYVHSSNNGLPVVNVNYIQLRRMSNVEKDKNSQRLTRDSLLETDATAIV